MELIDEDQVLAITGETKATLAVAMETGRLPKYIGSPWQFLGKKANGRPDYRWNPRWSRIQVENKLAENRVRTAAV